MNRRQFVLASAGAAAAAIVSGPVRAVGGHPGNLAGDIAIVREALLAMHPGLYRYAGPRDIARGLARLETDFVAAPDLERRYLALSRFLATIRCGHSYANFFNQSKAVATTLFDRPTRLPFAFRWIGDAMVVTASHSDAVTLPPGTIVTAIDGMSPRAMLSALMPYARADGSNDDKRRALLSVEGNDTIEFFDVFQGLLFPPGPDGFVLDTLSRGERRRVIAPPITLAQRRRFARPGPSGDTPMWQWEMRGNVAVLTMDNWAVYNSKWDWQRWLGHRLDSLSGARGLIVDLRRNEGGNDCGDLILARLAARDIVRPKTRQLVRYRRAPETLLPYLDTWDPSFRDWGTAARPYDDRYLELVRNDDLPVLPAKGPRMATPLIVLTSAQNSSATFQFANLARSSGLATLIGTSTGGNRRGINGGAYFFVRLPASGLEFDLPLIGYFPHTREPDAGLVPDIRIVDTIEDVTSGRDRTMEAALARLA